MSKVDFNNILSQVKDTTNYSKQETVEYIKKLVQILIDQPFDAIISPEAFVAIKSHLKGNMENHVDKIRLSDVFGINGVVTKTSRRNEKAAKPIDYSIVMKALHEYLHDGKSASASEIKKVIKDKTTYEITTGQWQSFRKKLPLQIGKDKWDLEKIGGDKAQSRWKIKKVK